MHAVSNIGSDQGYSLLPLLATAEYSAENRVSHNSEFCSGS